MALLSAGTTHSKAESFCLSKAIISQIAERSDNSIRLSSGFKRPCGSTKPEILASVKLRSGHIPDSSYSKVSRSGHRSRYSLLKSMSHPIRETRHRISRFRSIVQRVPFSVSKYTNRLSPLRSTLPSRYRLSSPYSRSNSRRFTDRPETRNTKIHSRQTKIQAEAPTHWASTLNTRTSASSSTGLNQGFSDSGVFKHFSLILEMSMHICMGQSK
ncbi:unnamed protein product [Protopolystoma xenopodis]|uniref:Uncharacterized protein n=1 Tax=Protopolystoma xenopodis TaxID=117903 RepID=A0A3S5CLS2_9PLAT|nr:unnamed protein product [Protopolystoma xenopodis]